ncbi:MAG: TolC family protein [Bacteroidia bacterium]|nr:TolC family protein [Bacteroidia bacterium]NND10179.1 TolC family protein [Flavobacteriaceae bacterium]NNK27692.1 TolC family protein [Flavobacteriaceae bacterium]RZV60320.1 MAG: TolC family protein [Flavobacteriaceae bacterium]
MTTVWSQEILLKDEAIKITIENNLGIKIAKNSLEVADNNADILNSGYLPTITGNAGASLDRQTTEGELANGETRGADGVETKRYNASVNLNYTLFDGLGRFYDYKRFKEEYGQSELQVRETIENTVLQLFSVFYEVARLEENVINLQEALEVSKNRLKRAGYQFEYGQNTGLDVLNAEVNVNTDSINLINAEQLLRNTKRDLNLVMNRDLSTSFEVDTTVVFVPNITMENFLTEAKQNNVQMLLMEKDILISEYSLKSFKGGYLPTVGLTGSYGWNKSSNNNPIAFAVASTNSGLSAGLNLSWNLFDGGRTIINVRNAKVNYETQELLKQQTELQIERDINNAWDTYRNALFVLDVQEKNLQTNQNNFERTNERYKLGQVTSIEFRQAQLNLLGAKLAKSQSKYEAKLAELQMLQVGGQLLNTDF